MANTILSVLVDARILAIRTVCICACSAFIVDIVIILTIGTGGVYLTLFCCDGCGYWLVWDWISISRCVILPVTTTSVPIYIPTSNVITCPTISTALATITLHIIRRCVISITSASISATIVSIILTRVTVICLISIVTCRAITCTILENPSLSTCSALNSLAVGLSAGIAFIQSGAKIASIAT